MVEAGSYGWEGGLTKVLDLTLSSNPPSSPPLCQQEAVWSQGSGWVWRHWRAGADEVQASWLALSPQGPETLAGGVREGSS